MPSPSKVGAKKPRYLIEVERLRERLHGITLKHNDVVINNVAHRQKIKELENEVYDLKDEVIRLSERNVRLEAEVGRLRKVESRGKQDRNGGLQNFLSKGDDAKILLHVLSTLIVSTPALTVLRDGISSTLASSLSNSTSPVQNASALPTPLSPHQPFAYWQPKLNPQGTVKASASPVGIDGTLKEEDEPSEDFAQFRTTYKSFDQIPIEFSSSTTSLSSIASSSSSCSPSQEAHQPPSLPPTQSAVLARSQSRSSRAARRSSGFLPPPGPNPILTLTPNTTSQSAPQSSSGVSKDLSSAERSARKHRGHETGDIPDEWETVEIKQEPLDEAKFLTAPNEEPIERKIRVGDVELFDEIPSEEEDDKRKLGIIGRAVALSTRMEIAPKFNSTRAVASATRKGTSLGLIDNSRTAPLSLSQSTSASNISNTSCSRPRPHSNTASSGEISVPRKSKPLLTTKPLAHPPSTSTLPSSADMLSAPVISSNSTSTFKPSVSKPKTSLVGSMKPPNSKTAFTPTSSSVPLASSSSAIPATSCAADGGPIKLNGSYTTNQAGSKGGSSMVRMKDVADQLRKGIVSSVSMNSPPERLKLKGRSTAEEEDVVAESDMNGVREGYLEEEDLEGEEDRRRRMRRRVSPVNSVPDSRQDTTSSRSTLSTLPPGNALSVATTDLVLPESASSNTTSGPLEEVSGRRGRERKNVNYKEPSLMTKMRKPADDSILKPKHRNTLSSSSRASSQEAEHDLLSSMDARNLALVVPRNDLVRRKSSLPKKLPIDNSSTGGRTGSGSHARLDSSEDEEEELGDEEEEDDDFEKTDDRNLKGQEDKKVEVRRIADRYSSISVDLQDEEGDSADEKDDDYDGVVRRMKIITPAPRASTSTSTSSSTTTRRRDSGLTVGSKKGRTKVLSEDEDDVMDNYTSIDTASRASSTRRQSSRRASIAG